MEKALKPFFLSGVYALFPAFFSLYYLHVLKTGIETFFFFKEAGDN